MRGKNFSVVAIILLIAIFLIALKFFFSQKIIGTLNSSDKAETDKKVQEDSNPLMISSLRKGDYPGSEITIEETLTSGSNYQRYIASYKSQDLKIYALLTVPNGEKPQNGWPVIVFNHGYIPPAEYKPTERYVAYTDAFSRNGYIVFKPDYRGNGNSQGQPEGAYYSPAYTIDDLNAIASIKKYKDADSTKIGLWGHSLGGNITLRDLVVHPQNIKAAVIWGGVVGTYDDLINNWHRRVSFQPSAQELALRNRNRQTLLERYRTPAENPVFWNSVDPNYFLQDITAPIQLHAGENDEEVPIDFSRKLYEKLRNLGKTTELFTYPGDDHNISANLGIALERSVEFFDRYLKK